MTIDRVRLDTIRYYENIAAQSTATICDFSDSDFVTDEMIEDLIGDSLLGDAYAKSIIGEAASESKALYEFMAEGVPLDIDGINYKQKLTVKQLERLTESAVRFYAEIIDYMRRIDVSNYK